MVEIVATVGQRLRQALDARHTTAAELSRATGISRGSLSQYINDKFEPKHDRIRVLADALRVSPLWLMGIDVPMEAPVASTDATQVTASQKIRNLKDTLQAQQNAINNLVVLVDEVDASLHPSWHDKISQFAGKYARLSMLNQEIINSTIDTMLKTQTAQGLGDDVRAKEKTRPEVGGFSIEESPRTKKEDNEK